MDAAAEDSCHVLLQKHHGLLPTAASVARLTFGLLCLPELHLSTMLTDPSPRSFCVDCSWLQLMLRVHRLPSSGIALMAWTYAHLRHTHTGLFQCLSVRAVQLSAEGRLRPTDARQLLYAAAKLGVRDQRLMKACAQVRAGVEGHTSLRALHCVVLSK
jgi:hypothetical protein